MVILDLFSGAGGLSEGFFREGATFVGHVEADTYACDTLRTRSAYWNLKNNNKLNIYHNYLLKKITRDELWDKANITNSNEVINSTISDETFNSITQKIKNNLKTKKLKKIDIIIGGPPCQAYSIVGRARMKESVSCDPRNLLYQYYVQFLKEFQPKRFVFENVPGLKTAGGGQYFQDLKKALDKVGYHIELDELIASDYGVLQNRKRIIIIGWRKDKRRKNYTYPAFEKIENRYLVKDVLNDLPRTKPKNMIEGKGKYIDKPNKYLKISKVREDDFDILTQHETRMHNKRDLEIYKEAITAWNREKKRLCYAELAKRRPELITHNNTHSFTNRFNVVKANEPASHTILAHIAMDGHYYIHPDITQLRSLSVREAARLQSFPDDFYFEGPRTSQFRQIGNAVPPKMAEQIAKGIKEILKK
ncbi:MAG: DNA-cytosine methyltransferase (EC [uncultured Sulfurovum sp.]|uniref:Cytosine-specific methyltransferase n=1 Tax=uncultured Sulfurovum sp. TaxID=269237 RepID=A0A6S6TNS4_9BACT|nr:MAG: DNA-cytosine methyltransferase (EC [uncultured Sulfurovum sp.]